MIPLLHSPFPTWFFSHIYYFYLFIWDNVGSRWIVHVYGQDFMSFNLPFCSLSTQIRILTLIESFIPKNSIFNQLSSFHKFSIHLTFTSLVISKVNPSLFSMILTFLWWVSCRDQVYWIIYSWLELGSCSTLDLPWFSISSHLLHSFPFGKFNSYHIKISI